MEREVLEYYGRGKERGRLEAGYGPLERERTREVLSRVLPRPPATVADVGGGAGAHALWLGLSEKALSAILAEREVRPFVSVADPYRRTPVESDALENLIRAGFLDGLHPRGEAGRAALLGQTRGLPEKRKRRSQPELPLPHPASWWESRAPGLDLRRHPLSAHRDALRALRVVPGRELREMPHSSRARAAGVLECLQAPPTRSGALVHFLLTEDESGLLQSTIFERLYRESGHILYRTSAFLLDGRVEQDPRRGFSFVADRIQDLNEALQRARSRTDRRPRPRKARRAG